MRVAEFSTAGNVVFAHFVEKQIMHGKSVPFAEMRQRLSEEPLFD
jgi:hypothetical protein